MQPSSPTPERVARHGFVVPAFGDSPFLESCLSSLKAQTAASPVLLTTSTPSDFITAVAQRFDIEVLVNPVRGGIGSDWNFALAQAPWPLVTLAHQDDWYAPSFAERSIAALDASERAVIAFTDHDEISDAGEPRHSKVIAFKRLITRFAVMGGAEVQGVWRWALLAFGNPIGCSAVTFHIGRLGEFRFVTDMSSNLDWEAWRRLHERRMPFVHVAETLVSRRYNEKSATAGLIQDGRRLSEDRAMFARLWPAPLAAMWAFLYRAGYR